MKTETLPFATRDYKRLVAKEPHIQHKNRFVESNPTLSTRPVAAISRPALRKVTEIGTGPVRAMFSAPSLFDDDMFVVSGLFLYSLNRDLEITNIAQISEQTVNDVSWAAVANIEEIPARLFIAEGGVLYVYTRNGEATGTLQASGVFSDGDVVRIGDIYYRMSNGSVDSGAPAGTMANPWRVNISGEPISDQLTNLFNAITGDAGIPGTDYSTATAPHPTVRGNALTGSSLTVSAKDYGAGGNAIATTETGANSSWGATTLTGGGDPQLRQVFVPQDAGAVSIVHINSFVIVVPVQSEELATIGKFYWIEPGDTFIDPLNFANAERASDEIHQTNVFGDLFWLFGVTTTEPWLVNGNLDAPMQRYSSILFDRGSWEGTAVQVKNSLVVVDEQGGVFKIQGGEQRMSRPDIEERIRRAMQIQTSFLVF